MDNKSIKIFLLTFFCPLLFVRITFFRSSEVVSVFFSSLNSSQSTSDRCQTGDGFGRSYESMSRCPLKPKPRKFNGPRKLVNNYTWGASLLCPCDDMRASMSHYLIERRKSTIQGSINFINHGWGFLGYCCKERVLI